MTAIVKRICYICLRIKELLLRSVGAVRSAVQAVVDYVLDRLVTWLIRHYQPTLDF